MRLAHGRSGDKGDKANIGVIARKPGVPAAARPVAHARARGRALRAQRTQPRRALRPAGLQRVNFLLHQALGGGGMASLRTDPLAKCYAQVLLSMEVPVPDDISL